MSVKAWPHAGPNPMTVLDADNDAVSLQVKRQLRHAAQLASLS